MCVRCRLEEAVDLVGDATTGGNAATFKWCVGTMRAVGGPGRGAGGPGRGYRAA